MTVVSKHRMDVSKSDRAPPVKRMSDLTSLDQALINAKSLSQLDTIGKCLNVIESNSVHRSQSKVKKSVFKPIVQISLFPMGRMTCKKYTKLTHNVP